MSGKLSLLDRVRSLALPICDQLGLTLVDEEYVKENGRYILRLTIDKEGGVTFDDCQALSQAVSPQLDEENIIKNSYILEVASPGVERPLKKDRDFVTFRGRLVRITTYAPIGDKKAFIGTLLGKFDDTVQLELREGERVSIPSEMIAKARLYVDW